NLFLIIFATFSFYERAFRILKSGCKYTNLFLNFANGFVIFFNVFCKLLDANARVVLLPRMVYMWGKPQIKFSLTKAVCIRKNKNIERQLFFLISLGNRIIFFTKNRLTQNKCERSD